MPRTKTNITSEIAKSTAPVVALSVPEEDMRIVWNIYNSMLSGATDSDGYTDTDLPLPPKASTVYKALTVAALCFAGQPQTKALDAVGWKWMALYMARKNNKALDELFMLERDIRMQSRVSELEGEVISRALDGSRKDSMLLSMFMLKGWVPQYKDNAVADSGNRVDVKITIDGIEASARIRGKMGEAMNDKE